MRGRSDHFQGRDTDTTRMNEGVDTSLVVELICVSLEIEVQKRSKEFVLLK